MELKNSMIINTLTSLEELTVLDKRLEALFKEEMKTVAPKERLLEVTATKALEFIDWNIITEADNLKGNRYKMTSYYAKRAGLIRDSIYEYLINTSNINEMTIYDLRVSIRIFINNLVQSLDSYTNIFKCLYTIELIGNLKENNNDDRYDEVITALEDNYNLNYDIKNILKEASMDKENLNEIYKKVKNYLIPKKNISSNQGLFAMYSKLVNKDTQEYLKYIINDISIGEVRRLIETPEELQQDVAEDIEEKTLQQLGEISIYDDYILLYEDIIEKKGLKGKYITFDILKTDINNLCESIIKGEITEDLKKEIIGGKENEEFGTDEF